jgi:NADH:ubiquinone oxidoreductase subunit 3 (subunit A)
MELLFAPPVALAIYLVLVYALNRLGRTLSADESSPNAAKSRLYASGEVSPQSFAAPGYRPFFVTTLFFAMLHLGVIVLATGQFSGTTALYLLGLAVALLALILG